jgi:hypothetical protein
MDEDISEEARWKKIEDQVEDHLRAERLLKAAHELRNLPPHCLTPRHRKILGTARDFAASIADLIEDPNTDGSWKKQGEQHGKRDALIYYKVDDAARLTCRIETAIEASLLVPILSVMNESELYATWIPSWTMPKIGIESSELLEQISRVAQIIRIVGNVPWPFTKREVLIKADAVDEIDERQFIAIRMTSDVPVGGSVPPPSPEMERIDFEGAMLLRPCPRSHELLLKSKHVYAEPVILISFKMFVDPHMTGIPTSVINFITRTVIGTIWGMFLSVAEDVRNGKRFQHKQAISAKKEFYDWMAVRIGILLEKAASNDPMSPLCSESAFVEELEAHKAFISYLQG